MIRRHVLAAALAVFGLALAGPVAAQDFAVIDNGRPTPIYADSDDHAGALRAIRNLQTDLGRVAGSEGALSTDRRPAGRTLIIVGTLGQNDVIDRLVRERKLDVSGVAGVWEAYVQQIVERPMRGVDRALVIAGADMRGTIYGVYDLVERAGVSPWSFWADVPPLRRSDFDITETRVADHPRVRYRGIFINDENPALYGWVNETYGGFNAQFYERVFDLILRSKGNYLWPAMWGKAIYDDDPQSPILANEMGVVLGTSHHEPLMRAHVEWERYGEETPWNYTTNAERLREFWRTGIERMGDNESLVTVGMRGDGDEPMSQDTAIDLLETIVRDQRQIIADVTGRPASEQAQIWALYKEVQDYYDQGMDVPDDITLLFADDNWGNVRRLPALGQTRPGGFGIYYHFDYVGGPRNYKWLNTNQIERVWEQMQLSREYGADRVWIVNVGDIKPMEYPISFFLDYAWNPEAYPLERLADYPREWAAQTFGPEHAEAVGGVLTRYAQLAARRKPELLAPDTFSLVNFGEAERVMGEWAALEAEAARVRALLPAEAGDAFFQVVQHHVMANANQHALYIAAGRNRLYAAQGRVSANAHADEVERLFARDQEITAMYHTMAGGKWNHMMSQTHIGYTIWQQPETNIMPEVQRVSAPARAAMGVAVEGDARAHTRGAVNLPSVSPFSAGAARTVQVFSQGGAAFEYTATSARPYVRLAQVHGRPVTRLSQSVSATGESSFYLDVDWAAAPTGVSRAPITIRGAGRTVTVNAVLNNPANADAARGFIEADGYVAMEAASFTRAVNGNGVTWQEIPHLGRTHSGVTIFPRAIAPIEAGGASPRLEYDVHLFSAGEAEVQVTLSPTLNFTGGEGLRYAVSVDDGPLQIVNVHLLPDGTLMRQGEVDAMWEMWVANASMTRSTTVNIATPGAHTVKIWAIDPGLVIQRVVIATDPLPASYLGPVESMRR